MGLTTIDAVQSASIICYAIAAVGCIYALAAAWLTRGFAASPAVPAEAGNASGITILKPLHGAEPGLYSHLASFCAQDYPGPVQMLFGVSDPNDPAIPIADSKPPIVVGIKQTRRAISTVIVGGVPAPAERTE